MLRSVDVTAAIKIAAMRQAYVFLLCACVCAGASSPPTHEFFFRDLDCTETKSMYPSVDWNNIRTKMHEVCVFMHGTHGSFAFTHAAYHSVCMQVFVDSRSPDLNTLTFKDVSPTN
jgi:hypothetical protein